MRTFENKVVYHPEGYEPTYADLADLRFAAAYFIAGAVLAGVEAICERLASQEGYWWYTAAPEMPEVITGLHLPAQTVSSAGCRVEPGEVIRSVRAVRARGEIIVAAGHSHGLSPSSVSLVDEGEMETLAQEGTGWSFDVKKTIVGELGPAAGDDVGPKEVTVQFPDSIGLSARLSSRSPIDPDLGVALTVERSRRISSFSTSNARFSHLFALFEQLSCPTCGDRSERHIKPRDITLHVIGEIEFDPQARQRLIDRVDEKVRPHTWAYTYSGVSAGAAGPSACPAATASPAAKSEQPSEPGSQSVGPAPFVLFRGEYAAAIPAVVLEEAAARSKALALALGWYESPSEGASDAR